MHIIIREKFKISKGISLRDDRLTQVRHHPSSSSANPGMSSTLIRFRLDYCLPTSFFRNCGLEWHLHGRFVVINCFASLSRNSVGEGKGTKEAVGRKEIARTARGLGWELVGVEGKRQLRRLGTCFIALLNSNPVFTLSPRANCLGVLLAFPYTDSHFNYAVYNQYLSSTYVFY